MSSRCSPWSRCRSAGVVTVPEALAGFSDPNVVLIAALFIVGEGLVRTGLAVQIGDFLLRRAAGSEGRLLCPADARRRRGWGRS